MEDIELFPSPEPTEEVTMEVHVDRPMMTTPFEEYTITEGLLLLLVVLVFIAGCVKMLRGGLSWLLS